MRTKFNKERNIVLNFSALYLKYRFYNLYFDVVKDWGNSSKI